jgi:hypothetical protein
MKTSKGVNLSGNLSLSWGSIVGGALELDTQFEKLQGNTVYVRSSSPAATAELRKLETQILRLVFGERYGVSRMVVRPGRIEIDQHQALPSRVRHRRGQKHKDTEAVREACSVVIDEELRGALETFLSWKAPESEKGSHEE